MFVRRMFLRWFSLGTSYSTSLVLFRGFSNSTLAGQIPAFGHMCFATKWCKNSLQSLQTKQPDLLRASFDCRGQRAYRAGRWLAILVAKGLRNSGKSWNICNSVATHFLLCGGPYSRHDSSKNKASHSEILLHSMAFRFIQAHLRDHVLKLVVADAAGISGCLHFLGHGHGDVGVMPLISLIELAKSTVGWRILVGYCEFYMCNKYIDMRCVYIYII
jgi:hypothetical protein